MGKGARGNEDEEKEHKNRKRRSLTIEECVTISFMEIESAKS